MNKKITISSVAAAILSAIVAVEGGYVNDPDDPGGPTKYGITQSVAREYGYTGRMEDLTKEQANIIYLTLYVKDPGFDKFLEINPAIAHKLIDAGVNVGTSRVSLWFQKALNTYSRGGMDYPMITEDGILGTKSIETYLLLEKQRGKEKACTLMIKALDAYQLEHYFSLRRHYKYVVGWVDNRISNVPLDQCSEYNLVTPLLRNPNDSY